MTLAAFLMAAAVVLTFPGTSVFILFAFAFYIYHLSLRLDDTPKTLLLSVSVWKLIAYVHGNYFATNYSNF
jgi:hypothetical protein